jgi:ABC-type multidrug transport system ATPase subunit
MLRDLKRDGMTLVFSSHRPDDILALADRILMIEKGKLQDVLNPDEFATVVGSGTRLVMTLSNGHSQDALNTLAEMGLNADRLGKNVSVTIHNREKARVLAALARDGIEIDDFELERGSWTGQ